MQWDEANEVTVRVSWRVRLPSAFLTSDISAPCPRPLLTPLDFDSSPFSP